VNYEQENRWLYFYGLHLAYENDDGNEVWQLGASDNPVRDPELFTREEALGYVRQRRGEQE
jgi:hypothetical protein